MAQQAAQQEAGAVNKVPQPTPIIQKTMHRVMFPDGEGTVTALCFGTPKPINRRIAGWTMKDSTVTCRRCLGMMAKGAPTCVDAYEVVDSEFWATEH
jgi:hypothetical protein